MKRLMLVMVMMIMAVLCFQDIAQGKMVKTTTTTFRHTTVCNGEGLPVSVPRIVGDWMERDGVENVKLMYIDGDPTFYLIEKTYSWFVSFYKCNAKWVIWGFPASVQGWVYKDEKEVLGMPFKMIIDKLSEIDFELFVSDLNE